MASNIPISQLPNGGYLQPEDMIPVSRPSSAYYVDGERITTFKVNPMLEGSVLMAANTLAKGSAVYITPEGQYALAIANDIKKCRVVGFAHDNYNIGDPVYLDVHTTQPLTTVEPGEVYYLSATTLGAITKTPKAGAYLMQVGIGNQSDPYSVLSIKLGEYPTTVYSGVPNNYKNEPYEDVSTVTINHTWGVIPQVQVLNEVGAITSSYFVHNSLNTTVVNFPSARSGNIILTT